jgi:flagellin-like hook-associated protein FlgL
MSDVVLSAGVRQNLLSLQNTASLMATTQNRLATGKKVNTALDNPTNFFTSAALKSRAGDLSALLDSMSNGIKTLEAADNGITAITKTIEQMQSTLRQARQDKSFKSTSYAIDTAATGNLSFTGGAVTGTVNVPLTTNTAAPATDSTTAVGITSGMFLNNALVGLANTNTITIDDGVNPLYTYTVANAATETVQDLIDGINGAALNVTASLNAQGALTLTADDNTTGFTLGGSGLGALAGLATQGVPAPVPVVNTVDAMVTAINNHADLTGKVRASNDNGRLRVENMSTGDLTLGGVSTVDGQIDGTVGTSVIDGNSVRANFVTQFNGYIDQLNKLSDDASFNGVNLLRGDKLKITFNEAGTSTIEILAKDAGGTAIAINTSTLGILQATNAQFDSDDTIDARLTVLGDALANLRAQGSAFGSNLSIVQNRQDFTKAMINTLETGGDNLVLADSNEEGANMLALQTRQQLSTTALSLSAQADQAVLRLFG